MVKAVLTFFILLTVLAGFVGCIVDLDRKAANLVVKVAGVDGAFSQLQLRVDGAGASYIRELAVRNQDVPLAVVLGPAWIRLEGRDETGALVRVRQRSVHLSDERMQTLTLDLSPQREEFNLREVLTVEKLGDELVATSPMVTELLDRIEDASAGGLTVREVGIESVTIEVTGDGQTNLDAVQDVINAPIRVDIEGVRAGVRHVDTFSWVDSNPVGKSISLAPAEYEDLQEDLRNGQVWWTLQGPVQEYYPGATVTLDVRYSVRE